jgi:hypothetical protein
MFHQPLTRRPRVGSPPVGRGRLSAPAAPRNGRFVHVWRGQEVGGRTDKPPTAPAASSDWTTEATVGPCPV